MQYAILNPQRTTVPGVPAPSPHGSCCPWHRSKPKRWQSCCRLCHHSAGSLQYRCKRQPHGALLCLQLGACLFCTDSAPWLLLVLPFRTELFKPQHIAELSLRMCSDFLFYRRCCEGKLVLVKYWNTQLIWKCSI